MSNLILALDTGCAETGYVLAEHDGKEIRKVLEKGKVLNDEIFRVIAENENYDLAVEMVASYGMPVGREVFETCVWIGRFWQEAERLGKAHDMKFIYRKDEKLNLCGTPTAKDSNIIQALIDRYAPYATNKGKGTKAEPGFFYGFKADIWQAFAVAVTYFDRYISEYA